MTSTNDVYARITPLPPSITGPGFVLASDTVTFTLTPDVNTLSWKLGANSKGDEFKPAGACTFTTRPCAFTYHNITGPGASQIPVRFTGCDGIEHEFTWVLQVKAYGQS